ncbi:30S ribosomal protein S16 [Glycomyces buryatensis]|uniref:Small ribosomal subunit protein bS16 n=1 Tax=Glycomyces buryatensis TaxID=2570927 RepID=A0A4S8Q003_9ACTN|nr:30S ribosomal protein S16 [Glycomyces buryatensis]THV35755.1 30S ribosomal protein S16 [Glycomyces buryatensis]
MAVKIRLTRMGKIRSPQYRIVIADSRVKRDGKVIENVGIYHPKENPSLIEVKSDRIQHWLSVGAQPSEAVKAILCKTGDWQSFKGLPAPGELKVKEPKAEKEALYIAALKESGVDPSKAYVPEETPAKKTASKSKKSAEKADESAKTEEAEAKTDEASEDKGE